MKSTAAMLAGIGLICGAGLAFAAPASAAMSTTPPPATTPKQIAPMPGGTMATSAAGFESDYPVIELQEALDADGANLQVDGIWGPRTKAALESYQRSHGLLASGELTGRTRKSLGLMG